MPEHEPQPFRPCAVCERTILRGERVVDYLTPDSKAQPVCALCRERAEAAGWVRADSAAAHAHAAPARRRRAFQGFNLRERAARYGQMVRPPKPDGAKRASAPARSTAPALDTPERRIGRAIERFNSSDQTRVVAGLSKSLGPPQVAIRDLAASGAEVTVAWDLSWYRWEVGLSGERAPRRVGKGSEISDLEDEGLEWNATVDEEGRLRWRESS